MYAIRSYYGRSQGEVRIYWKSSIDIMYQGMTHFHTIKGTLEKALQINLDPQLYGTIAEIGAGQEVVRNFL